MDCRKFNRNLEDYLEDGLDFAGRFSMERHAQQCFGCSKTVADALKLRQLAQECRRVKAPEDFEARLMRRIQAEGIRRPSWRPWHMPVFIHDWPLWRMAAAGAAAMLIAIGVFLFSTRWMRTEPSADVSSLALPQTNPVSPAGERELQAAQEPDRSSTAPGTVAVRPEGLPVRMGYSTEADTPIVYTDSPDSEYVECLVPGPGGRQLIMRLPSTIRTRYGQPSEEYFIRNVSH